MPKRTNPFQHLFHVIYKQLSGGDIIVEESKELECKITGKKREVDIVVIKEVDGSRNITAIECRARSRNADVEWVEQMLGKHIHLPSDKLILVSESKFTPQAIEIASAYNVSIVTLRKAVEGDWAKIAGQAEDFTLNLYKIHYDCQYVIIKDKKKHYIKANMGDELHLDVPITLKHLLDNLFAKEKVRKSLEDNAIALQENGGWMSYSLENGKCINIKSITGELYQCEEVRIGFKFSKDSSQLNLKHAGYKEANVAYGEANTNSYGKVSVVVVESPSEGGQVDLRFGTGERASKRFLSTKE